MNTNFWKNKRVYITGVTGFKGSWLCQMLLNEGAILKGYSLKATSNPNLFSLLDLASGINFEEGDILDEKKFRQSIKSFKPDIIFHMAAQAIVLTSYADPIDTFKTNIQGTLNLLEIVRSELESCVVINVTSDKCYENNNHNVPFIVGDSLGGKDPYSASKACAEIVALSYNSSFFKNSNTFVSNARAGNVIGGGDWSDYRLIPDIMKALQKKEVLEIRNPKATRPWQHVLEPLSGYCQLAEKLYTSKDHEYCRPWNFGPHDSSSASVVEIITILNSILEKNIEYTVVSQKYEEAPTLRLNIDETVKKVGWRPALDSKESIQWTAEWYQSFDKDPAQVRTITNSQIQKYKEKRKNVS